MSTKGHLATGVLLINSIINWDFINKAINYTLNFINNTLIQKFIQNLTSFYQFFIYKIIPSMIDINMLIISFFLLLLGTMVPDLDYLLTKNFGEKDDKNAYLKYHRQYTHSFLFIALTIIYTYFYLHIVNNNINIFIIDIGFSIEFFLIGYSLHLIADIFFGNGGIPLLFYSDWNKSFPFRIKFYLFKNNGIMEKIIFLLGIFSIFLTFYNFYDSFLISLFNFFLLLLLLFSETSLKSFKFIIKFLLIYLIIIFFFKYFE